MGTFGPVDIQRLFSPHIFTGLFTLSLTIYNSEHTVCTLHKNSVIFVKKN